MTERMKRGAQTGGAVGVLVGLIEIVREYVPTSCDTALAALTHSYTELLARLASGAGGN